MKILVVDDMATNRKLLNAVLEAEGHEVVEAADGLEALALLRERSIDGVISDILMPRMDGYRLCYEIRANEKLRHLPFIFYTSTYLSASDAKLALEMGADKFLTKPSPSPVILQALREAMERKTLPPVSNVAGRDLDLMKEYSQQLVNKLEEKNFELTERNRELILSEQKLQLQSTALETAANAVVISDCKGTILWVNPAFIRLTGYSSEEAVGQTPRLFKSGRHEPKFYQNLWSTILAGKTWRGSFTNRRKDGTLYHDEHTITPVLSKEGVLTHFVAIMNDVTERKLSEERLHLLGTCIANLNDIVLITEADPIEEPGPRIVFANEAFEQITGYSRAEAMGRSPRFLQGAKTDAGVRAEFHEALRTKKPLRRQILNYAKDGREYWLDIDLVPLLNEGGECTHFVAIERDITERKEAEAQLLWKTAFFEAQVHSSHDGILIVDSAGKIILQNQRMLKMWQIPGELVENRDDQKQLEWVLAQVKQPGAFKEKVLWLYAHPEVVSQDEIELNDGRTLDRYSAPVQSLEGQSYGRIWSFRDITDRKKTEEIRRATELRYRTLFEYAPIGILIANSQSVYIDANASICEMLGYTREELVGRHASDIVSQSEVRQIETAITAIQARGDYRREWLFRRKDGTFFHAEVNATLMPDGNLLGMIQDVTEKRRSQAQIVEQADFLDKAQDAILVHDLQGKVVFWNKGAERIYGWSSQEMAGCAISDFLYADANKFQELNTLVIGQGEWKGELQQLTRDRGKLTVEGRWTLVRDPEGNPKAVLSINTDITEKKKIEAQFMRAQRMESIGTLAGGIAHDLNNILTPIMMSIELLKSTVNNPQAEGLLETIEVSAKRGADIVRQVLSFARGLEGQRVEIQPKHLLKDIQHIIKDTFPKDIQMQFDVSSDIWTIVGDPTQVHQILLNLCVNSRDAMPDGGTLKVRVKNIVLDEQYASMNTQAKPGRYVCIAVADTGSGIPPDILEKIFEPFFTTKPLNKGTGLGLSTVLAIVKSHEGVMNVASEVDKGATFEVLLPAMMEGLEAKKDLAEEDLSPRGNGETILVVDDESSILSITSQTLEAYGYRVLTATDGAEAVAVFARHHGAVSVAVVDMMMPILDGPGTIYAIKRINPRIRIIAASGLKDEGNLSKMSDAGVTHFLTKPYTASALLKTLQKVLS